MFDNLDVVGLWDLLVEGMNRLVAWLAFVLGGKDFDSDYGQGE